MKVISLVIMILFGFINMFAQSNNKSFLSDDEINELSSKYSMKLLLNETQKSNLKSLLKTYSSQLEKIAAGDSNYKTKKDLVASINSEIEKLLDSKQKMKYNVLEEEFWTSVNKEESD